LKIAHGFPHFAELISPPADELLRAFAACNNHDRFSTQLPEAQANLDAVTHRESVENRFLHKKQGKAFSQAYFLLARAYCCDYFLVAPFLICNL